MNNVKKLLNEHINSALCSKYTWTRKKSHYLLFQMKYFNLSGYNCMKTKRNHFIEYEIKTSKLSSKEKYIYSVIWFSMLVFYHRTFYHQISNILYLYHHKVYIYYNRVLFGVQLRL